MAFARQFEDSRRLNAVLIGLTVESVHSHIAWLHDLGVTCGVRIPFPAVADQDKEVARLYDMVGDEIGLTVCGVFLIDPEGKVRFAMYHLTEFGRSAYQVLRDLLCLQTVDAFAVAQSATRKGCAGEPVAPLKVLSTRAADDVRVGGTAHSILGPTRLTISPEGVGNIVGAAGSRV